jgi:site-specific DNA-cytosine methylase
MNCLDLFCGTKSFTKEAIKFGYECYTVDILEQFEPTFCCDILEWDYKQFPRGFFKIIWASPNCKDYSSLNFLSTKKKDLTHSNKLVEKTIEIIEYFNPTYWYMENPDGGLLRDQDCITMNWLPHNTIDYCKYGFSTRKRTRIWNDNPLWTGRSICQGDNRCKMKKDTNKHVNFRWITRGPGKTSRWEERIKIPKDLMVEILQCSP